MNSRNADRRKMYVFKRGLEKLIKEHELDKVSGIQASYLASFLIRQYTAIETLVDNLENLNESR